MTVHVSGCKQPVLHLLIQEHHHQVPHQVLGTSPAFLGSLSSVERQPNKQTHSRVTSGQRTVGQLLVSPVGRRPNKRHSRATAGQHTVGQLLVSTVGRQPNKQTHSRATAGQHTVG